jgi:transcriptional regulator with XRE-family HTH domain
MTPEQFKAWRTTLGLTQQDAADKLGISRGSVQLYERGQRHEDGRAVEIPPAIIYACDSLALERAAATGNLDLLTGAVRERVEKLAAILRDKAVAS